MRSWLGAHSRGAHGRRATNRSFGVARSCLAAVALAATGSFIGLAAGTAGGSTGLKCPVSSATKCYGLTVIPTSVAHGITQLFTFKLKNDSGTKNLGSAKITAPAGFTIVGATPTANVKALSAGSVTFGSLNVAPTGTATLGVKATTSCAGKVYRWGLQVKQSNTFNGTGNTFQVLKATATQLTGTYNNTPSGCALAFVPTNEPKSTTVNSQIRSAFGSKGTPVEVEAVSPQGSLLTTFSGTVKLTLSEGPTGATLSGGGPVAASHGIAVFPTLRINKAGSPYQLKATSTGFTGTPPAPLSQYSTTFTIYNENLKACTTTFCTTSGNKTTAGKKLSISESTEKSGLGFLGLGFGAGPTCKASAPTTYFLPTADTAVIDVFKSTGVATPQTGVGDTWTVTYEITKAIVKANQPGASQWQVCFASTTDFVDLTGVTAPQKTFHTTVANKKVTVFVGLLRTCSATVGAPCILTRHKDNAGNEIIVIKASGDSYVRP